MSDSPMLMNPKYLKYCRYYKGEETEPKNKSYNSFLRFWYLEREYYTDHYETKHEYWENEGQKYCEHPAFLKKFVSKIKDKTIRGFVAYATTMITYNCPMDDGEFILRYKYDQTVDSDETTDKSNNFSDFTDDTKSESSYRCLYYKGENECPYNPRSVQSTFWRIEKIWDSIVRKDEVERSNKEGEFLYDFPDAIPSINNVPLSLKATLYNQYCHFGGDKSGFEDYLRSYLSNAPKA